MHDGALDLQAGRSDHLAIDDQRGDGPQRIAVAALVAQRGHRLRELEFDDRAGTQAGRGTNGLGGGR